MNRFKSAKTVRVRASYLPLILALCALAASGLLLFHAHGMAWAQPDAAGDLTFTELLLDDEKYEFTSSVAWGDIDGDGDLDLAVGNGDTRDHIGLLNRLYRNDGGGIFTEIGDALGYAAEITVSVAWGDMDGDGDLDLAVGNVNAVNRLYRNDGGNVFAELPGALGSAADATYSVVWGDMDSDGDLDLAVGNDGQPSLLYRNDGVGVFTESQLSSALDSTRSLAWGDMDNDGDLDLAVGNFAHANRLYQNDGSGVFTNVPGVLSGYAEETRSVAWGDMDGDGDLDLAVGNHNLVESDRLYRNDGNNIFTELPGVFGLGTKHTTSLAWGDMDSDGDLDLASGGDNNVSRLYRNEGGGVFTELVGALGGTVDYAISVAWGDMDGDGDLDMAVGDEGEGNRLYRNDSGGAFTKLEGSLGGSTDVSNSVAWGDMDGDGDLDMAVGNGSYEGGGQVNRLYRNDGGNVFTELPGALGSAAEITYCMAWGDMDGDGDLDLAVGNSDAVNRLYRNDGGNVFTELPGALGSETDPTRSLAWGDMDGDGDLDLAVGNFGAANRLYRNDGAGVFTLKDLDPIMADTWSLAWGDMDGDGDLDLATSYYNRPNLVYRNLGDGNFEIALDENNMPVLGLAKGATYSVAWGDMDGDSDLDLAVGNGYNQVNRLYRNNGAGIFTEIPNALGGDTDSTTSLAWGDMDGDGDLDLVAGNYSQVNRLYRNNGAGVFTMIPGALGWPYIPNFQNTSALALGDADGDGDLDLAVADRKTSNYLFRNPRQGNIAALPSNPLSLAVRQPAGLPAANFYVISGTLSSPTIPFTYTLFSPEGNPAAQVLAQYSLDGGGKWRTAAGSAMTATAGLMDSFDPIIGTQWQLADYVTSTTGLCGGAYGSGLNFGGPLTITRQAVTRPLDTSNGAQLSFLLRVGTGAAPCEDAEAGENILLEYSLDGSSWNQIASYDPDAYASFTPIEVNLPPEARSTATHLRWRQAAFDEASGDNWALDNVRIEIPNVFLWDTFASGFFGQSSNVVMKFTAYPVRSVVSAAGRFLYPNSAPGPWQQAFASAVTQPFPARGTQLRVYNEEIAPGNEAQGARVYRLPQGIQTGGSPIANNAGVPYTTDVHGYLQGRGILQAGDTLFALLPISTTERYTLYAANFLPLSNTLAGYTVQPPGVQEVVVSASRPLLAFNLDISLEWDARNDGDFLQDMEDAIQNTSTVLLDISDGQIAIGNVTIHQNRQNWLAADIVVYAQSGIRPRASMGGVVDELMNDVYKDGRTISNAYGPGQIRMGPNWDPFGNSTQPLTKYWESALAHELAHYLLFLPDNYLGVGPTGAPTSTDCRGSFMTNTYDDDYSEFLTRLGWVGDCTASIAEKTTGRVDWETVKKFYPALNIPTANNPGPAIQPLDITQVNFAASLASANTLSPHFMDVRLQANGLLKAVPRAQAFVFQDQGTTDIVDDLVLPLGGTVLPGDSVNLRGAAPGDRLCLFSPPDSESGLSFSGCVDNLTTLSASIPISPIMNWHPNIIARAVTSSTLQVTVTLSVPTDTLNVQFYPAYISEGAGITIRQWASGATASSERSYTDNSALQATGAPDTSGCGDFPTAWASATPSALEWIELDYPKAVIPTEINIYHSFTPSSVTDVILYDVNGNANYAYFGFPDIQSCPYVQNIILAEPIDQPVNKIRIQIDQSILNDWDEIDAVELVGKVDVDAPWGQMTPVDPANRLVFTHTLELSSPSFEGWLRVWIPGAQPAHEAMSQLFLSPPWGPNSRPTEAKANSRAWGANNRQLGAPVASGDGQVSIFNFTDIFAETGTLSLQALNSLPNLPPWLAQVGQGYRFLSDKQFPRAIAFDYLQREVPAGVDERLLNLYYSPDEGLTWQRLPTQLETEYNRATAIMPENAINSRGIYALVVTRQMPALEQGWNLFSYPILDDRPVELSLASIEGKYTSVYYYTKADHQWLLYDATVVSQHAGFAPLVNDLQQLLSDEVYWIYATEAVTPYLGVTSASSSALAPSLSLPPATYYGWVQPGNGITLTAGSTLTITAWIDDNLCGVTSSVVESETQTPYKLQVASENGNGCGAPGREIILHVGSYELRLDDLLWDNTQAWYRILKATTTPPPPIYKIFLSLLQRQ